MAGLYLQGGFGGTAPAMAAQYGSSKSYTSGVSATIAAFGGDFTTPTMSTGQAISPTHSFGLAVWLGIGAITGLYLIRRSLPN